MKRRDTRNLPLAERLAYLSALRAELAALRAEQAEAEPAPLVTEQPADDANELVDRDELAQLRALWGAE